MQAGELITTMPVGNRHVNFVLIKIAEKKIQICIIDYGKRIPEAELDNAFQPFFIKLKKVQ